MTKVLSNKVEEGKACTSALYRDKHQLFLEKRGSVHQEMMKTLKVHAVNGRVPKYTK